MKIVFFNKETGENLDGEYMLDNGGTLWSIDFGSADSVTNPTSLWAGTAGKVDTVFGVKILDENNNVLFEYKK